MGFLTNCVRGIASAFKKRFVYEEDAERVDIRIKSLPDWLYKITLKDPVDLKQLGDKYYKEAKFVLKDIGSTADALGLNKILDQSLSKYRAENLAKNKDDYVKKVKDFVKDLDKTPNTIEGYRSFFQEMADKTQWY
jgi:hypothetical protein